MATARHHKPILFAPEKFSQSPGGPDPALVADAAQKLAHALLDGAQRHVNDTHDAATSDDAPTSTAEQAEPAVDQLVNLVDELGMDTIAELWADAPPISLGGALWRLYVLRTATLQNGTQWAQWYRAGYAAQVARAIAGAVEPPGADELQDLTAQILSGAYTGDLATALDRAAAYCRVTSLGQAHHSETLEHSHPEQARALLVRAQRLLRTAEELDAAAGSWRAGVLD